MLLSLYTSIKIQKIRPLSFSAFRGGGQSSSSPKRCVSVRLSLIEIHAYQYSDLSSQAPPDSRPMSIEELMHSPHLGELQCRIVGHQHLCVKPPSQNCFTAIQL